MRNMRQPTELTLSAASLLTLAVASLLTLGGASLLLVGCASLLLVGCASGPDARSLSGPVTQLSFSTPQDAVAALTYAAASGDREYSTALFGPEADELLTGDPEVDAYERERFVGAIQLRHDLSLNSDGSYDILIGEQAVPFPVPLVNASDRWMFDTLSGVDRLTDIRVGFNELHTIEALAAIALAEREYASIDRDGDGVLEFAQRFLSTQGKQDGLYWGTGPSEPNSPLGAFYTEGEVPVSRSLGYHGYFYKVLNAQGPGASGGARSYRDQAGNLATGFAILAYPAVYEETAIMTFQMGPDGVVYQKDLGATATPTAGRTINAYDPSNGWVRVGD